MRIGNCKECDKKKVYLEKDGKCMECLKEEGDLDSANIMRIDICNIPYNKARECIERAKNKNGFVRVRHDTVKNLESNCLCDLDFYEDGLSYYSGPLDGREYPYDDYQGQSKETRIVNALVDAYSDMLQARF